MYWAPFADSVAHSKIDLSLPINSAGTGVAELIGYGLEADRLLEQYAQCIQYGMTAHPILGADAAAVPVCGVRAPKTGPFANHAGVSDEGSGIHTDGTDDSKNGIAQAVALFLVGPNNCEGWPTCDQDIAAAG